MMPALRKSPLKTNTSFNSFLLPVSASDCARRGFLGTRGAAARLRSQHYVTYLETPPWEDPSLPSVSHTPFHFAAL